jgi:hypothetical protein
MANDPRKNPNRELLLSLIPEPQKPHPHPLRKFYQSRYTWTELAVMLGYSQPSVSRWMLGHNHMPEYIERHLEEFKEKVIQTELEEGVCGVDQK